MNNVNTSPLKKKKGFYLNTNYLVVAIAIILLVIAVIIGSLIFDNFFKLGTFTNLLINNAHIGISAVGMTLVIITGGIDLSVGAVVAIVTMICAYGSADPASTFGGLGLDPVVCMIISLVYGILIGAAMGCLIQFFDFPPFIATLAGMFFSRGSCYILSTQAITVERGNLIDTLGAWRLKFFTPEGGGFSVGTGDVDGKVIGSLSIPVFMFIVVVIIGIIISQYTKFGRTVYAIGGNEQSAQLMGLPVKRTKVLVYTLNGLCSALAGIAFTFFMRSGSGLLCVGMEMDVIASVVIGGTLLTGGVGYVFGTVFGVLTLGLIQTFVTYASLNSWYTKIFVGVLLLFFIGLQRIIVSVADSKKVKVAG